MIMEEYSEKAKQEFQKAKTVKRVVPDLTPKELILFARMIAESASIGEFSMKLNLGFDEIELHKNRTGITGVDQAKAFLRSLENVDEMASLKEEAKRKKQEDPGIVKFDSEEERVTADTPYDAGKMQDKLENVEVKSGIEDCKADDSETYKPLKSRQTGFTVSPNDEAKFKEDASKFGINFLIDKWCVERADVISELKRLGVSLEQVKR